MVKTYEFEDEERGDILNEPITEKEAAKKKILISQPEITNATSNYGKRNGSSRFRQNYRTDIGNKSSAKYRRINGKSFKTI